LEAGGKRYALGGLRLEVRGRGFCLKPIAKRSSLRAVSSYELEANLLPLKANSAV